MNLGRSSDNHYDSEQCQKQVGETSEEANHTDKQDLMLSGLWHVVKNKLVKAILDRVLQLHNSLHTAPIHLRTALQD